MAYKDLASKALEAAINLDSYRLIILAARVINNSGGYSNEDHLLAKKYLQTLQGSKGNIVEVKKDLRTRLINGENPQVLLQENISWEKIATEIEAMISEGMADKALHAAINLDSYRLIILAAKAVGNSDSYGEKDKELARKY